MGITGFKFGNPGAVSKKSEVKEIILNNQNPTDITDDPTPNQIFAWDQDKDPGEVLIWPTEWDRTQGIAIKAAEGKYKSADATEITVTLRAKYYDPDFSNIETVDLFSETISINDNFVRSYYNVNINLIVPYLLGSVTVPNSGGADWELNDIRWVESMGGGANQELGLKTTVNYLP